MGSFFSVYSVCLIVTLMSSHEIPFHSMPWERTAGVQRLTPFAAWTPVSLRSTTANRVYVLQRPSSPETRNPARKTDCSYLVFLLQAIVFAHRAIRWHISQPAKPAGESSVQI